MRPIKGIVQNIRPHDQPEGTYFYGKNGIQNWTLGVTQNEPGLRFSVELPGQPIGVIEVDRSRAVIMTLDSDALSEIGYYDRTLDTYTKIINDNDLDLPMGFTLDHPITGEFQRNAKDEVIIVFTDKDKFPKILNCDNPAATVLDDLRLFLQYATPTITASVTPGGSLEKGAYFVAVKYLKTDGSESDVAAISRPAIVSSPNVGSITDKAVSIDVTGLDTNFDQLQLFFIQRVNGDYKAFEGPKLQIAPNGALSYTYTGEELFAAATLEELLIPSPVYIKVGTIGQLNDALYIADLEKDPELDLQQYANLIKLRVKSELISVIPLTPEHVSGNKRSLMHQEVYAIYVRYHKTIGGWTKFFIIPGNDPIAGDLIDATNVHELDLRAKIFQVQDTNRNILGNSCDTGIWRNTNELYPDLPSFDSSSLGGRNLRAAKTLYHRMPSIAFCRENYYSGETDYGRSKLDVLSLEISNVSIPPEQIGKLDGYEIAIAKRTLGNSLVLGQGLTMFAAQPANLYGTALNHGSTGGNWHSMTVNGASNTGSADFFDGKTMQITGYQINGTGGAGSSQTARPGARIRLHSFDMLFNQPAVTPSYMSAQLRMRVNNINQEAFGYLEDGELNDERVPIMAILDYSKGAVVTLPTVAQRTRVIQDPQYVPNNVLTGEYQNGNLETAFEFKMKWLDGGDAITNNALPIAPSYSTVNKSNYQRFGQRFTHEDTYLANLMDIKPDVYSSFFFQHIIPSGTFIPITTAIGTCYPGDVFLSEYSFHTYGWFDAENHPGNDAGNPSTDGGYKIVRRFICEAVSNIALRYEVEGNIYSKWWPHNPLVPQPTSIVGYLYDFDRNLDPNQFGYSRDLNTMNEFGNYEAFNPYLDDVTRFPYRIHRSGKLPRQGKLRSWRNFLPLDYYEMQRNMGHIKKVLGMDDHLLIHTENALFRSQDKLQLESDVLSVTLGSGDIFKFEPQESLSSKQGYAGNQNELASILTPAGYIFVDAKQGQVFLFKDGLKLMNQGLNQFLQEQLPLIDSDNPFTSDGITIGYDPKYKRILLTAKSTQLVTSLANFVPDYAATAAFFSTLVANTSIVFNHGRYLLFRGVNVGPPDCPINHDPVFETCSVETPFNVDEASPIGTFVGQVIATDSDGDTLTYSITGGNTNTSFWINPTTGQIYTNISINFTATPTFTLEITVTDGNGGSAVCEQTIDINDICTYPKSNNYIFTIDDSAVVDDLVGVLQGFSTNLPDQVTITLGADSAGLPFAIDSIVDGITATADLEVDGALDASLVSAYQFHYTVTYTKGDCTALINTNGLITIYITHNSKEGNVFVDDTLISSASITQVQVSNGGAYVSLVATPAFPVIAGGSTVVTIPLDTVNIKVTATSPANIVTVVDTAGNVQNQTYTGPGVYTFTSIVMSGMGSVTIRLH